MTEPTQFTTANNPTMRIQTILILLLASVSLTGQGIMLAGGAVEAEPEAGLLDDYPGASAAYSLRSLSSTYTGPVVQVRRGSDNELKDFTAVQVSTIPAWVGAGDGFVRIFYDQSGNGRDAVQVGALLQPKIVNSGVFFYLNGNPAIDFDGANDYLTVSSVFTTNINISGFAIASVDAVSGEQYIYDNSNTTSYGGGYSHRITSGGQIRIWAQDAMYNATGGSITANQQFLSSQISYLFGASERNIVFQNGSQVAINTGTPDPRNAKTTTRIGMSELLGGNYNGKMQELVVYPSNQSTNRTGIESNINTYYNIY